MISIEELVTQLAPDIVSEIKILENDIQNFRKEDLAPIILKKLQEHFKIHHVYHSAGIEGNKLTLQETALIITDEIDISGKSVKDAIESKNLGKAVDLLLELSDPEHPISENYIQQLHSIVVGEDESLQSGKYRNTGVIITGSAHTPPQPFEVPIRMQELFKWIEKNRTDDPIITSAVAHHEMVNIHPFLDGNGRTARLLLNLLLMQHGIPICNIKRDKEDRLRYYNALSEADKSLYESIIQVVIENSKELFTQYKQLKEESSKVKQWATELGIKDKEAFMRKKHKEYQQWLIKMKSISLDCEQAVEMLNTTIETYTISFYPYTPPSFDTFLELHEKGETKHANFFSVRFYLKGSSGIISNYIFSFYCSRWYREHKQGIIPLILNYYDKEKKKIQYITHSAYAEKISFRSFYVDNTNNQTNTIMVETYNTETKQSYHQEVTFVTNEITALFTDLYNIQNMKEYI